MSGALPFRIDPLDALREQSRQQERVMGFFLDGLDEFPLGNLDEPAFRFRGDGCGSAVFEQKRHFAQKDILFGEG